MSDSDLDNHPLSPPEDAEENGDLAPPASNSNLDMDESDLDKNGDLDSELSEVDEAEFADFDPTTVAVADERPVTIDDDVARTLKAAKRKRTDKDEGSKKPKEARREKPKRKKTRTDLDAGAIDDGGDEYDSGADGEILEGKRRPKPKSTRSDGDRNKDRIRRKEPEPEENEENLTPDERRRRALDRAMDAALKNPNKRRRKKDEVVCCGCSSYWRILIVLLGS